MKNFKDVNIMFHGTHESRIESILKYGLKPDCLKTRTKEISEEKRVYLSLGFEPCIFHLCSWTDLQDEGDSSYNEFRFDHESEWRFLWIDVEDLRLKPEIDIDFTDPIGTNPADIPGTWYSRWIIPPDRIIMITGENPVTDHGEWDDEEVFYKKIEYEIDPSDVLMIQNGSFLDKHKRTFLEIVK